MSKYELEYGNEVSIDSDGDIDLDLGEYNICITRTDLNKMISMMDESEKNLKGEK